jgi:hypothetical protein
MTTANFYRRLLWLYPADFRQQFSEEMVSVFEQRAGERFVDRKSVPFAFLLTEFSSIVKGACVMWLTEVLPIDHNRSEFSSAAATTPILSVEEATKQRNVAIRNMVAAIADHDFISARRYSDEEVRLKRVLEELQSRTLTEHCKLA